MNQPTKINLIKMVRSILSIQPRAELKPNEVPCPECNGTGLDEAHKWPDGSCASCEQCQGYGTVENIGKAPPPHQPTDEEWEARIEAEHIREALLDQSHLNL